MNRVQLELTEPTSPRRAVPDPPNHELDDGNISLIIVIQIKHARNLAEMRFQPLPKCRISEITELKENTVSS